MLKKPSQRVLRVASGTPPWAHWEEGVIKDKERKMEDDLSISRPGHCAYLGSLLWERTLPYNEIEYVDLDEFLLENGLPPSPAHQPFSPSSQPTPSPSSGVVVDLSRPASCASSSSVCSSSGEGLVGSDYDHHCSKTGLTYYISQSRGFGTKGGLDIMRCLGFFETQSWESSSCGYGERNRGRVILSEFHRDPWDSCPQGMPHRSQPQNSELTPSSVAMVTRHTSSGKCTTDVTR
ncbi:hypothetical protein JD844_001425 [Phrynosoma platyrhinos]|uniref:Uncharacterized protein n=1 Tax=Phrynosoma platyrhinos TaxID=52577 RepID=A0ABQ7TAF4_PHRPL|nr:hypothetical protein JD844_001425 [Phrynosoma platyrhinos]